MLKNNKSLVDDKVKNILFDFDNKSSSASKSIKKLGELIAKYGAYDSIDDAIQKVLEMDELSDNSEAESVFEENRRQYLY